MRYFVPLLLIGVLALGGAALAPRAHIHYYAQLIRATDSTQPPQPGSPPVGAKLAATFNGPLRWNHYWEICRREADVSLGATVHLPLANQRAVDIDLTRPGRRTITAFQNRKVVGCTISPMGEAFTLIGGDRSDSTGWFIVVRRDQPGH